MATRYRKSILWATRRLVAIVAIAAVIWAAWGVYDNFPALDRSGDTRPSRLLTQLTDGLDDQRRQVARGVYFTRLRYRRGFEIARKLTVLK